jgi:hypothetical protein
MVYLFPFEASKGNKNASIFKVLAKADPSLRSRRQSQKDFSLPLLRFCLLAYSTSQGKTYKAAQTLAKIFLHSTAKIGLRYRIIFGCLLLDIPPLKGDRGMLHKMNITNDLVCN